MPLNPDVVEDLANPVVQLYREVELFLLREIAKSVARVGDAPDWQERQLLEVQRLRRAAEAGVSRIHDRIDELVVDSVQAAVNAGATQAMAEIGGLQAMSTVSAASVIEGASVVALAGEATRELGALDARLLRSTDDLWRSITQQVTARTITGAQTVQQAFRDATAKFAKEGLTGMVDSAGRRWKLDTYAEMAVRTATNNALMHGHSQVMMENGYDLVRVSWHPNPAPMCAPYEGKVLSLSGMYRGTVSVPSGVHEGDAVVNVVASLDEAIANGFRHPACRHTWSVHIPGTKLPDVPDDPNHEGYKATQQQRYYERKVREWKRAEAAAVDDAQAREARSRVRGYQARIRDVVKKHNLPRRRHREQLR